MIKGKTVIRKKSVGHSFKSTGFLIITHDVMQLMARNQWQ